MSAVETQLREAVSRLLAEGKVRAVYAHRAGWTRPAPACFTRAEQAGELIFNPGCPGGLAKYLLGEQQQEGAVGIVARGCEVLAVQRLVRDRRVNRDRAFIIGVTCREAYDPADPERRPYRKCQSCEVHTPPEYDLLIGEPVLDVPSQPDDYSDIDELERLGEDERYEYWMRQFSRCIRCFACRNVCPACSCRECCFDVAEPEWLSKEVSPSEQVMFHFTRAFHVAGRCVNCQECERVCPVGIPLMVLNRKLARDVRQLFAIDKPFVPGEVEPLGAFRPDDPEEFM